MSRPRLSVVVLFALLLTVLLASPAAAVKPSTKPGKPPAASPAIVSISGDKVVDPDTAARGLEVSAAIVELPAGGRVTFVAEFTLPDGVVVQSAEVWLGRARTGTRDVQSTFTCLPDGASAVQVTVELGDRRGYLLDAETTGVYNLLTGDWSGRLFTEVFPAG